MAAGGLGSLDFVSHLSGLGFGQLPTYGNHTEVPRTMAATHQDAAQTGEVRMAQYEDAYELLNLLLSRLLASCTADNLQIGTVSWFTALAAIELALTHHAVKKVCAKERTSVQGWWATLLVLQLLGD
jgi:hypothetical protein